MGYVGVHPDTQYGDGWLHSSWCVTSQPNTTRDSLRRAENGKRRCMRWYGRPWRMPQKYGRSTAHRPCSSEAGYNGASFSNGCSLQGCVAHRLQNAIQKWTRKRPLLVCQQDTRKNEGKVACFMFSVSCPSRHLCCGAYRMASELTVNSPWKNYLGAHFDDFYPNFLVCILVCICIPVVSFPYPALWQPMLSG